MNKKHMTTSPKLVAEAVLTACKYFLIFMILNNLFWGIIHFKPTNSDSNNTRVEINQSGNRDIHQEINN